MTDHDGIFFQLVALQREPAPPKRKLTGALCWTVLRGVINNSPPQGVKLQLFPSGGLLPAQNNSRLI